MEDLAYVSSSFEETKDLEEKMKLLTDRVVIGKNQGKKLLVRNGVYVIDIAPMNRTGKVDSVHLKKDENGNYNANIYSADRNFINVQVEDNSYRVYYDFDADFLI